MVYVLLFLEGT